MTPLDKTIKVNHSTWASLQDLKSLFIDTDQEVTYDFILQKLIQEHGKSIDPFIQKTEREKLLANYIESSMFDELQEKYEKLQGKLSTINKEHEKELNIFKDENQQLKSNITEHVDITGQLRKSLSDSKRKLDSTLSEKQNIESKLNNVESQYNELKNLSSQLKDAYEDLRNNSITEDDLKLLLLIRSLLAMNRRESLNAKAITKEIFRKSSIPYCTVEMVSRALKMAHLFSIEKELIDGEFLYYLKA